MWRWAFLVIRPQLSSPNPNFSKSRTRTANSDFWSWLTHQLLGRLKSTTPNLQIYLPKKKANSEKLGLGIDNPHRIVFWVCRWTSAWRGLMTGIFGILESSATQWLQDGAPTQKLFFHRHIHSLWSIPSHVATSSLNFRDVDYRGEENWRCSLLELFKSLSTCSRSTRRTW